MREKDSGDGKGYAFVTFRSKDLAAEAIDTLNNTDFRVSSLTRFLVNCLALICLFT